MKKVLSFLTVLCLLLSMTPAPVLAAEPAPTPTVFDEGVRDLTCDTYGNLVDYAQIGGWIVSRGYLMEQGQYCLIGQAPDGRRVALTDVLPGSFVPAGDEVIYYGKDANGRFNWVTLKPGAEKPVPLDLSISDEVFYADKDSIWYYTYVGAEKSIRKLTRKGGAREGVARTDGFIIVKMDSGGILAVDYDANELKLVKDSKDGMGTTLYKPEEPIVGAASVGKSVWVQFEREFGLLKEGAVFWRLPGFIERMTGTTDQFVFLLSFPDSDEYDVMIFNEVYQAYAWVGYVPASENAFVELQPGKKMTVWGPEASVVFDIPKAEEWIPYGYYDIGSARASSGVSDPGLKSETDQDDMVTVTIPANLCALTDEATATAQAEAAGISMTVNRDGSYTYFMTPEQHREQLAARALEIRGALDMAQTMEPYNRAIKAYTTNDNFSEITFTVDADQLDASMAALVIAIIGMTAPTYQALEGTDETPVTVIKLIDQITGGVIATYTGPDDFMG